MPQKEADLCTSFNKLKRTAFGLRVKRHKVVRQLTNPGYGVSNINNGKLTHAHVYTKIIEYTTQDLLNYCCDMTHSTNKKL